MLVVYTYYENQNCTNFSGFRNSQELAYSVALSIKFAKANVKNARVKLVCNEFAKSILVDHHEVKFDSIDCCLDSHEAELSKCWAFAKIIAYARQAEPFIHIDNDFYILKPLKESLFDNDLIFQNIEEFSKHKGYQELMQKLRLSPCDIPRIYKIDDVQFAYNCGFVFCRDRETVTTLFKICNDFLKSDKNQKFIKDNSGYINHFLEQLGIAKVCKARKNRVVSLIADFNYGECRSYDFITHLWGNAKRKDEYVNKIKELLGSEIESIVSEPIPDVIAKSLKSGVIQTSEKQCANAVVISMRRNHGGRLRLFNSKFKFNINLNVIEGIDGLTQQIPKYCDLKPGTYGCLLSHIECIKFAKENKLKNILILEDDVRFVQDFEYNLAEAMKELPDDWDMLWLGGADQVVPTSYSSRLNKLMSSWGGYGYILRDTTYDFWLDVMSQKTLSCDDYYRRYHKYFNSFRTKRPYVLHSHTTSVRISADKGIAE